MQTLDALPVRELNILKRKRKMVINRAIHANLGCIGRDGVEYIDKVEEEGDE
jgi:hypothetical protein